MLKKYRVRDYDFFLIMMLIGVTLIGILAIGSADRDVQNKQIIGLIAGVFLMVVLSLFDYHIFLRFYWIIYIGNLAILLLVNLFGDSANNAQRWITIAGIRFQPSETAKILLILFFAQYIMNHREKFNTFKNLVTMIGLFLPQPDTHIKPLCQRKQLIDGTDIFKKRIAFFFCLQAENSIK